MVTSVANPAGAARGLILHLILTLPALSAHYTNNAWPRPIRGDRPPGLKIFMVGPQSQILSLIAGNNKRACNGGFGL